MVEAQRVGVHIVLGGHVPHVPEALLSLEAQTFRGYQAVVADGGSTDRGRSWLDQRGDVVVLRSPAGRNVCRAANDLLSLAMTRWQEADRDDRFVLCVAQDAWLDATCLEALVRAMEADPHLDIAAPVLSRARWLQDESDDLPELVAEGTLDAAGISLNRAGRPVYRMRGAVDDGAVTSEVVLGGAPAAFLVRARALSRLGAGEWFDPSLHWEAAAVDLAWRATLLGMKAMVVGDARAWVRAPSPRPEGLWARVRAWYGREARAHRIADMDWKIVRTKNDLFGHLFVHLPWTVMTCVRHVAVSIADPVTGWYALRSCASLPAAWRVRRSLMPSRAASSETLWRHFV